MAGTPIPVIVRGALGRMGQAVIDAVIFIRPCIAVRVKVNEGKRSVFFSVGSQ